MAKCFDVVGYIEPCNVVRQKYTGRALLITGKAVDGGLDPSIENNIVVTELFSKTVFNGIEGFVKKWNEGGGKALPIKIDAQNPFGVTIQGNTDSGRVMYTKTIPVSIPAIRFPMSEPFILGLQKGIYGSAVIVLESSDFIDSHDIFGICSPVSLDPTSVTRNEYENGGAWSFNLVCEEPVPNVICTMTGLGEALDDLINA